MKSSVYFLKNPWIIAFLLPIFTFAYGSFSNFTIFFFIIITVLILISSTFVFLPLSKRNVQLLKEEQSQQEDEHALLTSDHNSSNQVEDEAKIGFLDLGLPESYSENEIIGRFSPTSEEDSDFDCGSPDCSDGSIPDEEGLIEIELPTGNYVGLKGEEEEEEEHELCFEQLLPDMSPVAIYRWSEMNEEENLIEIDISLGSVKCSGS